MPFELNNVPAVFQHLMQELLAGLNYLAAGDYVPIYIDDI